MLLLFAILICPNGDVSNQMYDSLQLAEFCVGLPTGLRAMPIAIVRYFNCDKASTILLCPMKPCLCKSPFLKLSKLNFQHC